MTNTKSAALGKCSMADGGGGVGVPRSVREFDPTHVEGHEWDEGGLTRAGS